MHPGRSAEATQQMLVHAVRTMAEVRAQTVRMLNVLQAHVTAGRRGYTLRSVSSRASNRHL